MLLNDIAAISGVAPNISKAQTWTDSYNNMLSHLIHIKDVEKAPRPGGRSYHNHGSRLSRDFRRKSGVWLKGRAKKTAKNG